MNGISLSQPLRNQKISELSDQKKQELAKLKSACSDFESIFMHQMLKEMRKTVNKTGMVNGGQAEEIFSDMLDAERAKDMKVGLGDMLYDQLAKNIINSVKKN